MSQKDIFDRASEHVMITYDEDGKTRPPELAQAERDLHEGFTSWTEEHIRRYPRMGRLPYRPDLFPDQRVDRPHRPINKIARAIAAGERSDNPIVRRGRPAIYLARLAYFEFLKDAHARTLGSKALSETMVAAFLNAPADGADFDSPSIVEYTAARLDENLTVGLTSAHLQELSDIGELVGGLSIGLAEIYGFRYIDRIKTVINGNMTRQTYKMGRVQVPISWLVRTGTGVLWGVPPGESAEKHGIGPEIIDIGNAKFLQAFAAEKKKRSLLLAYVPSGSGAVGVSNQETGELEKIIIKDAEYTSTLTAHCDGGIIPANKYDNQIVIGSVIKNQRPDGVPKKDFSKLLVDRLMREHAAQARELTGVPIEYTELYPKSA